MAVFIYQENVDSRDVAGAIEFDRTDGSRIRFEKGKKLDLTADEVSRLSKFIILTFVPGGIPDSAEVLPHPVFTDPVTGKIPSSVLPVEAGNSIFGDGSDGDVVLDGTVTVPWASKAGSIYTMTRDCHLTSLTVNSGVTLKPAGWAIFCLGFVENLGTISNIGNAGTSAGVAGAVTPTGRYAGGTAGGAGNVAAGSAGAAAAGGIGAGSGSTGGAGSGGAGGGGGAGSSANAFMLRVASIMLTAVTQIGGTVRAISGAAGGGGGGGDATNKGGGGGGGGGTVAIFARDGVENAGTISVAGGAGGAGQAGNAGGGGGGGGGQIVVYTPTAWTPGTTVVTGGAAGAGVGTGVTPSAGAVGIVMNVILQ